VITKPHAEIAMFCLQLDDAELATAAALKAKKAMEAELQDLHQQLDAASKSKQEVILSTTLL